MDLLELLRRQLDSLADGLHINGFRSVMRHIEVAESHLARGVQQKDDTAFTDAIYRTNQAFEGSIKEAYRVLAGKDPQQSNTYKIENYLQTNEIFRERVLAQFRNYRTEWRNPSTHDYNLDFDESEALLAIVSVSAFAKLLLDQIAERLAFDAASLELRENPPPSVEGGGQDLVGRVAGYLHEFAEIYAPSHSLPSDNEAQLIGTLTAFLSAVAPDLEIAVEAVIGAPAGSGGSRRADFIVSDGQQTVVIEVKRRYLRSLAALGVEQVKSYISMTNSVGGVIFFAGDPGDEFVVERRELSEASQGLAIVAPLKYSEH
jgi:hypothetical protein